MKLLVLNNGPPTSTSYVFVMTLLQYSIQYINCHAWQHWLSHLGEGVMPGNTGCLTLGKAVCLATLVVSPWGRRHVWQHWLSHLGEGVMPGNTGCLTLGKAVCLALTPATSCLVFLPTMVFTSRISSPDRPATGVISPDLHHSGT